MFHLALWKEINVNSTLPCWRGLFHGSTTFDRKRIYANPSSYPNLNSNTNTNSNPSPSPNPNPNSNPNLKAQLCFQTDEMTSLFDQVYRYPVLFQLLTALMTQQSNIKFVDWFLNYSIVNTLIYLP